MPCPPAHYASLDPGCKASTQRLCMPHPLQAEQREVSTDVGVQFARAHGCLFVETSAKGNVAVEQAFEELVLKVGALSLPGV